MWKWSPTQREPARESVTQHSSWWTCELSRELPLSAFCLVPPKYSAGGSATLRESILKEILHKGSVALSGIKENQPENRGREILSEANSISGKVPLTPPVTIWLLSSCFSCARLNSRLTSPSLLSCVSAGCGSSQASTSCLWNLATWSRGRSNRKWCQEAAPWRCCAKGRPTPQQKGRSEGQTRFQALFLEFFLFFMNLEYIKIWKHQLWSQQILTLQNWVEVAVRAANIILGWPALVENNWSKKGYKCAQFPFIPVVWDTRGFCRQASNILEWYCLLHFLLLRYIRAVHSPTWEPAPTAQVLVPCQQQHAGERSEVGTRKMNCFISLLRWTIVQRKDTSWGQKVSAV